jgi:hypothetical protein
MNLKEYYKQILSEAMTLGPHVDDVFGKVVDHNASAGIDPNANHEETIARARDIVRTANANGHQGMSINEKGQIVKVTEMGDLFGRGTQTSSEVIRATTKPFHSNDGTHIWSSSESNARDYMGQGHINAQALNSPLPTPKQSVVTRPPNATNSSNIQYPSSGRKPSKFIRRMGGIGF